MATIVTRTATATTRGRKRAATTADGMTSHGSAGLVGPPVTATPTAMTPIVLRMATALTISG